VYKSILIATDGSELALKGVEHGLGLAKALNAKVLIVTVSEPWTAVISGEMAISFPVKDYETSQRMRRQLCPAAPPPRRPAACEKPGRTSCRRMASSRRPRSGAAISSSWRRMARIVRMLLGAGQQGRGIATTG
jgi:hypothetical protein